MSFQMQLLLLGLVILTYLGLRWWWWDRQFKKRLNHNKVERANVRDQRQEPQMDARMDMALDGSIDASLDGSLNTSHDPDLDRLSHLDFDLNIVSPTAAASDAVVSKSPWDAANKSSLDETMGMPIKSGNAQNMQGLAPSDTTPASAGIDSASSATAMLSAQRRAILNRKIDCIVELNIDHPVSGDLVLNLLPATRRIGSRLWWVEGLPVNSQNWEVISLGQTYDSLKAGIQLVNRQGGLNDVEFSEFVAKASQLAEGLGAGVDFPLMRTEVARARELEQQMRAHDICMWLHLQTKRVPWSFAYVQQQVRQAGFVAGVIPGRWVLNGTEGELMALVVQAQIAMSEDEEAPIHQLSLLLDVPKVVREDAVFGKPFEVMCRLAKQLSETMQASIVDQQGLLVETPALERTAGELEQLYNRMETLGFPAGAELTRRLFS